VGCVVTRGCVVAQLIVELAVQFLINGHVVLHREVVQHGKASDCVLVSFAVLFHLQPPSTAGQCAQLVVDPPHVSPRAGCVHMVPGSTDSGTNQSECGGRPFRRLRVYDSAFDLRCPPGAVNHRAGQINSRMWLEQCGEGGSNERRSFRRSCLRKLGQLGHAGQDEDAVGPDAVGSGYVSVKTVADHQRVCPADTPRVSSKSAGSACRQ
jgi:hypothetical protein